MSALKDAAEEFAKNLVSQNIAGLMMTFTPNGMMKALAMQGQLAAGNQSRTVTGYDVTVDGEDSARLVLRNPDGEARIQMKWLLDPVSSTWKLDDIAVEVQPK